MDDDGKRVAFTALAVLEALIIVTLFNQVQMITKERDHFDTLVQDLVRCSSDQEEALIDFLKSDPTDPTSQDR